MGGRNRFEEVTVVAVYGDGRGATAVPSIKRTVEALPGSRGLLITNEKLGVDVEQRLLAGGMDYNGYTEFVMYGLHNFIETEFCLIVQHDGWALDGKNWRDEWFEFDYVGGYTHAALMPNGQFYKNYQWTNLPNVSEALVVQNGGFSLRSKRFLEAPSKYGLMRRQAPEGLMYEDIQLCCLLRRDLEKVGVKFATDEEARLFSFEHIGPPHNGMDVTKIFGHHSRFRQLLSNGEMLWKLTRKQTEEIYGESVLLNLFENHYGYTVHAV
jgi:hypothetical protein